jgi:hypothetical protein
MQLFAFGEQQPDSFQLSQRFGFFPEILQPAVVVPGTVLSSLDQNGVYPEP